MEVCFLVPQQLSCVALLTNWQCKIIFLTRVQNCFEITRGNFSSNSPSFQQNKCHTNSSTFQKTSRKVTYILLIGLTILTRLLTVQSKSSKVYALKGRQQVSSLTSAERGILSTFAVYMSAGGVFNHPLVIFPRQRMKVELKYGAPPETKFVCHSSGQMQTETFSKWFDNFLNMPKLQKKNQYY